MKYFSFKQTLHNLLVVIWKLKDNKITYTTEWKLLSKAKAYSMIFYLFIHVGPLFIYLFIYVSIYLFIY